MLTKEIARALYGSEDALPYLLKFMQGSGGSLPWATFTGNPVSFNAPKAHVLKSLKASFSPVQDLHGYDSPWPGGGGKNKFNKDATPLVSGAYIKNPTVGQQISTQSNSNYNVHQIPVTAGTQYTFGLIKATDPSWCFADADGVILYGEANSGGSVGRSVTYTAPADSAYLLLSVAVDGTYKFDDTLMLVIGASLPASYSPYSNICPIDGWDALDIYDDPAYGGTIRWNQLAVNGNFSAKQTWTNYQCDYTVANNEATVRTSSGKSEGSIFQDYAFPVGHKILVEVTAKCVDCERIKFQCNNPYMDVWSTDTEYTTISRILTNNSETSRIQLRVASADSTPVDGMFKNFMVCDLTEMFGAGNEPATVDAFRELFPKDYYAYDNSYTETCVSAVNGNPWWKSTLTFGTTVFGGNVEVEEDGTASGNGTFDKYIFTGDELWYASSTPNRFYTYLQAYITNMKAQPMAADQPQNVISSIFGQAVYKNADGVCYLVTTGETVRQFVVNTTAASTVEEIKALFTGKDLAYEIETPVPFSVTASDTPTAVQGINTMWTDADTLTVEARAEAVNLSALQSLNMLLGGRYYNNGTADEPTDEEALDILLGR